jgi:hypothetical protein
LSLEAKAILIGLLVVSLAVGGYFAFREAYDLGNTAGKAETQELWDADRSKIQTITDAAIAAANKQRDDALEANEVTASEYQKKVDAANSSAADFSKRLSNALASLAANRSAPSQTGGAPTASDPGPSPVAQQLGQLAAIVTGLRTECSQNADQLDGLIASIKPQL